MSTNNEEQEKILATNGTKLIEAQDQSPFDLEQQQLSAEMIQKVSIYIYKL